jgi:hypothetical protein
LAFSQIAAQARRAKEQLEDRLNDLDVLCLQFDEQDQVVCVERGMVRDALDTQMLQEQP